MRIRTDSLRCRRLVTQRTVRYDLIILLPPVLDQHLTLKQSSEDFHVEKLVP